MDEDSKDMMQHLLFQASSLSATNSTEDSMEDSTEDSTEDSMENSMESSMESSKETITTDIYGKHKEVCNSLPMATALCRSPQQF